MRRTNWLILALLLTFSSSALAEETVEPTAAQQDYNNQGVVQMQQGKLPEAIAFFRSSLSLGDLNVTYLNLGRAYFRLGHCLDAREAYDAVESAPRVNSPSPAELAALLERFEKDYAETCSATVELACDGNPMVSVAGAAARECSAASTWPTKPGEQVVDFDYAGTLGKETIIAESGSVVSVSIAKPADETEPVVTVAEPAEESSLRTYGLITGGVGLALIATAVVYDVAITGTAVDDLEGLEASGDGVARAEELRDEIDGHQLNTAIIGGVGVAALATGVILYVLQPDSADSPSASIVVGPDTVGVSFGGSW